MDIYKQITELLKSEYDAGATYQELADKYGVSYTHMHNLLNGKRAVSGISLDFLFKLFPKATINLTGDTVSIHADYNSGNVNGVSHVNSNCIASIFDKVLESEDLSAEEKVKFLQVLKK